MAIKRTDGYTENSEWVKEHEGRNISRINRIDGFQSNLYVKDLSQENLKNYNKKANYE